MALSLFQQMQQWSAQHDWKQCTNWLLAIGSKDLKLGQSKYLTFWDMNKGQLKALTTLNGGANLHPQRNAVGLYSQL
ncbi:Protein of unknown function [Gryllus bimaculatus]|nr:Protein of unknown function [Gryllus bimaculatus]